MTTTVQELVTRAFYISGIVSREFQDVGGDQIALGRKVLDELLAEKLIDDSYIPYFSSTTVTGVIGQEEYFIDNLIEIDTITFVIDDVRYPMRNEGRHQYFGTARANNINSLPFEWHVERTLNGSNLFVYFKPEDTYTFTIYGKFGLSATTSLQQDLEQTYDIYYLTFLRYQLVDRLCSEYEYEMPMNAAKTLQDIKNKIYKRSAKMDLRMQKVSSLSNQYGLNYAQVNLGHGWTI